MSWPVGRPRSADDKAKISITMKGRPGRVQSIESRTKISLSMLGNQSALGHRKSPEAKKLIAEKVRGNTSALGHKLNQGARDKIAEATARQYEKDPSFCYPSWPTCLEYALQLLLDDAGFKYETQRRFGRRVVDFYVGTDRLVFEADGSYWHQDIEKDVHRDQELMEHGIEAVIHLNELDLEGYQVQT